MEFFFIVLIICLVIFLFCLFTLSHDDFILLRRNVTMEDVFNNALLTSIFVLLFSRIIFVILNPAPVFLNPLGFLLFPYFPGLSLVGGITGGLVFLLFLARNKGFPIGRIFDFFSLSFLCTMPFGFLGYILLSRKHSPFLISEFFVFLLLMVICLFILIPRLMKNGKMDGAIGFIFLITFSIVTLLQNLLTKASFNILALDNILSLVILIPSVVLLLRQVLWGKVVFRK